MLREVRSINKLAMKKKNGDVPSRKTGQDTDTTDPGLEELREAIMDEVQPKQKGIVNDKEGSGRTRSQDDPVSTDSSFSAPSGTRSDVSQSTASDLTNDPPSTPSLDRITELTKQSSNLSLPIQANISLPLFSTLFICNSIFAAISSTLRVGPIIDVTKYNIVEGIG